MKLRAGIVGLGRSWESRYLPALRTLADRFEVRGICEEVPHRAERAARELGAIAVDGYRALAARDDIDVILCLADQWYGVTPILAACDFGKAVYSAISFPLEAEEATLLRERVDKSGIAFMAELPPPPRTSHNSAQRADRNTARQAPLAVLPPPRCRWTAGWAA